MRTTAPRGPVLALAVLTGACAARSAAPARAPAGAPAAEDPRADAQPAAQLTPGRAWILRGPDVPALVSLPPGAHVLPALGEGGSAGVIVLEGVRGVTLDLSGASLRGTPPGTDLDRNEGWGIVLRDCQDVTVRGGTLGGYKACIAAFGCRGLVIEGVRFEGWYGDRLRSSALAEDLADWLWPHANDGREWVTRYGGAIALEDCQDAVVRDCRGRHGQNGILLTRCQGTRVFDCDFSFLSGWGLALYRTNASLVARNRFDYCVRGYSHGVYWRGQDSAGILLFERCSDNVFAENTATHGGDGVFLFAGRDLVEGRARARGEPEPGGSDRNVWWRNDFSYAVANAIEATFSSDNWAIGNVLDGSHQHGVWGGYSRRLVVLENSIRGTLGGGVSIEHGQECAIVGNVLERNEIGVELWWDEDPDLVGGPFGETHDTDSRDHLVAENRFAANTSDLVLRRTRGVLFGKNGFGSGTPPERVLEIVRARGQSPDDVRRLIGAPGALPSGTIEESSVRSTVGLLDPAWLARARAWRPPDLPGARRPLEREVRKGLDTIVIGEWGPWDFESGEPRPVAREPGGLFSACTWETAWFRWEPRRDGALGSGSDPRDDLARWRALAGAPLERASVPAWTDPWGGSQAVRARLGTRHFGLAAQTTLEIQDAGHHRLRVVSDDGVRVLVDGRVVLENWTWHGPTRDEAVIELDVGRHAFELEYFQIDGAWALSVELERAR